MVIIKKGENKTNHIGGLKMKKHCKKKKQHMWLKDKMGKGHEDKTPIYHIATIIIMFLIVKEILGIIHNVRQIKKLRRMMHFAKVTIGHE